MHQIEPILTSFSGIWAGPSVLNLSWDPAKEELHHSESTLTSGFDATNRTATLDYTWSHENELQSGALTIGITGHDGSEQISATWKDTFHQADTPMEIVGALNSSGVLSLLGTYEVPENPAWGWRIDLSTANGQELLVEMFNLEPHPLSDIARAGSWKSSTWAVRTNYLKAATD